MFGTFLSAFAALLTPAPAVPASDSPVRAHGETLVFSTHDVARDAYRLTVRRGERTRTIAAADKPFEADAGPGSPPVVYARGGAIVDERGRRLGTGRAPSVWRGTVASVRGDDVLVGGRVVVRVKGVTELELHGDRLAVVSPAGLLLVERAGRRLVARGPGIVGASFDGSLLGWYRRGEHVIDLHSGARQDTHGPADVSGYALLPEGRSVRVEPEGEDGRLRFSG